VCAETASSSNPSDLSTDTNNRCQPFPQSTSFNTANSYDICLQSQIVRETFAELQREKQFQQEANTRMMRKATKATNIIQYDPSTMTPILNNGTNKREEQSKNQNGSITNLLPNLFGNHQRSQSAGNAHVLKVKAAQAAMIGTHYQQQHKC
jgi:hypothetical protein